MLYSYIISGRLWQILLLLCFVISILSCSQEPTKVTVTDANRDLVAHLSPDPNILGNTEIFFIPATIQGSAIWLINGPGANIGVDIRDKANNAFIYFADSYIGKGDNVAQTGTQIPWGRWMRVRLVEYKSGLSGYVVSLLNALGMDFFNSLEDYMIEHIYESDLYLEQGGRYYLTTPAKIDSNR